MNIFFLDKRPDDAAEMHCDKHCVKMILEYSQMLSTAHRVLDGDDRGRIIRRNVLGPVDIGDQLLLMDSSREAKALDRR